MDKFFVISRTDKDFSYRQDFHIVKQKDLPRFLSSKGLKDLLQEYKMRGDLTIRTGAIVISLGRLLKTDLDSLYSFTIQSKSSDDVILANKFACTDLENSKLMVFSTEGDAEVAILPKNNLKNHIADFLHEELMAYDFEEDYYDFRWICCPADNSPQHIAYFDDVPFDEYLKGEYRDIYLSDKRLDCYFDDYELYCPPDLEVE